MGLPYTEETDIKTRLQKMSKRPNAQTLKRRINGKKRNLRSVFCNRTAIAGYTNSMIAVSDASPRRSPKAMMRV